MITGDLVKCIDTGSMGVITRVSEAHTDSLVAVDFKVLWPEGSMTWENVVTITPMADEEYAP